MTENTAQVLTTKFEFNGNVARVSSVFVADTREATTESAWVVRGNSEKVLAGDSQLESVPDKTA